MLDNLIRWHNLSLLTVLITYMFGCSIRVYYIGCMGTERNLTCALPVPTLTIATYWN